MEVVPFPKPRPTLPPVKRRFFLNPLVSSFASSFSGSSSCANEPNEMIEASINKNTFFIK
jgi:hypothetical protein